MLTQPAVDEPGSEALYRAWQNLRGNARDSSIAASAVKLGVSSGRLAAVLCTYGDATELRAAPAPLLAAVATLGAVTAVTRSSAAVLANTGTYGPPDIGEHTGIVIGDNIDLRIFPNGWAAACALAESTASGKRHSLHIFAADGAPVHDVVLGAGSDIGAFETLVHTLAAPEPHALPVQRTASSPARGAASATGANVDIAAYRRAYSDMQDTHDFFMLLQRFGLTRERALQLAGPANARVVARDAHRQLFTVAAQSAIPLMLFVANSGMVQISSGPVNEPTFTDSSCELSNGLFSLALDETLVARAWAVRKPTVNGIVSSLELYADGGELIAQVFGERHAGAGERPDWAAAIGALPDCA